MLYGCFGKNPRKILVGRGDLITPPEGARRLFEKLRVEDKILKEFEGACQFYKTIIEWLRKHS